MCVIPVAIGDPAGIGPQIALKSWSKNTHPFFVIGDINHLNRLAKKLDIPIPLKAINKYKNDISKIKNLFSSYLPVYDLPLEYEPVIGKPNPLNAATILTGIEIACNFTVKHNLIGMINLPVSKSTICDGGYDSFRGTTQFVADLSQSSFPVMMLMNDIIKVVPITTHIALKEVPSLLTSDLIFNTALTIDNTLKEKFCLKKPKIAMLGLNPHSGENGKMGSEERQIIAPALKRIKEMGIDISGTFPADTFFMPEKLKLFDVVMGCYHDQVLSPVKILDFSHTINVTLGLPFLRVSVSHGTAFDIAEQSIANNDSFISALNFLNEVGN